MAYHIHLASSSSRCILFRTLPVLLLPLFLLLLPLVYLALSSTTLLTYLRRLRFSSAAQSISVPKRPQIWSPDATGCASTRALFVSPPSPYANRATSTNGNNGRHWRRRRRTLIPSVMLRDTVVDRRYLTNRLLARRTLRHNQNSNNSNRLPSTAVVLLDVYFTLHVSTRIEPAHSNVTLLFTPHTSSSSSSSSDVQLTQYLARVESVTQTDDHLNAVPLSQYRPGGVNRNGMHVTEWVVSVSITFPYHPYPPSSPSVAKEQHGININNKHDDERFDRTMSLSTAMNVDVLRHLHAVATKHDGMLHMALSFVHFDGSHVAFVPRLPVACATGWFASAAVTPTTTTTTMLMMKGTSPTVSTAMSSPHTDTTRTSGTPFIPPFLDASSSSSSLASSLRTSSLKQTCSKHGKGAVLFSGTALYGEKNRNASYFGDIAHFAARALHGPHPFDAVFMSITVPHSLTTLSNVSQLPVARRQHLNDRHMLNVRAKVEEELSILGVSREVWHRLVLLPACRLGSSATGSLEDNSEETEPCMLSRWYNQYAAALYAYAMVSSHFAWAVSLDMDEVLIVSPSSSSSSSSSSSPSSPNTTTAEKANTVVRMDGLLHSTARREGLTENGFMSFKWVDFRIDRNDVRDFTRRTMMLTQTATGKGGSITDWLKRDESRPAPRGRNRWERVALMAVSKTGTGRGTSPADGNMRMNTNNNNSISSDNNNNNNNFHDKDNSGASDTCLAWETTLNGKAAVRCDHGLGFRIHQPVVVHFNEEDDGERSAERRVLQTLADRRRFPFRPVIGVRAWHPRTGSSKRACVYVAGDDPGKGEG